MASDRISKKTAELVHFPKCHWYSCDVRQLLANETVKKNLEKRIPINTPLLHSIHTDGFMNPILIGKNGWPIAGGQRLRVCVQILKKNPDWKCEVEVCELYHDEYNMFYLWPEVEFRDKVIAVYFQMVELVFKSLYYNHDKSRDGTEMTVYEDLGDRMKWNHKGK